jgi:hypothetical protein
VRQIGVAVQPVITAKEYGRVNCDQLKRLKDLDTEDARHTRSVADLSLDKMIPTKAARRRSKPCALPPLVYVIMRWPHPYTSVGSHSTLRYRPPAPESRMLGEPQFPFDVASQSQGDQKVMQHLDRRELLFVDDIVVVEHFCRAAI